MPGWGRQLPHGRVLAEMAALGIHATELGPVGYLPLELARTRAILDRHGLRLAGGFVPLVLHERSIAAARAEVDHVGSLLADLGADVLVAALVPRRRLVRFPAGSTRTEWRRLTDQPRAQVEGPVARAWACRRSCTRTPAPSSSQADDVERMLADHRRRALPRHGPPRSIGGADPADAARAATAIASRTST